MDEQEYERMKIEMIGRTIGSELSPIQSADAFLGIWEMRYGGGDRVRGVYEFFKDKRVNVETRHNNNVYKSVWKWRLNRDCYVCSFDQCKLRSLSFMVPIDPMPDIEGMENGTVQEERVNAWTTADGRIVCANGDASVIQIFTRHAVQSSE